MIDDIGNIVDAVYYNKLVSDCGSISHSGDKRDGNRKFRFNESIIVNLINVNYAVSYLAVLINSFSG